MRLIHYGAQGSHDLHNSLVFWGSATYQEVVVNVRLCLLASTLSYTVAEMKDIASQAHLTRRVVSVENSTLRSASLVASQ